MKICELLFMKLLPDGRSIQIKWIFSIKLPINFGEKPLPQKLHGMKLIGTLCEMVLKKKYQVHREPNKLIIKKYFNLMKQVNTGVKMFGTSCELDK